MPCLITIVALMVPRLVMFFIFLLTNWFGRAFTSAVWPILGFLFLPYTTLAYMAAKLNAGGVTGWWLVLVIVAVIVDLGHLAGAKRR